MPKIPQTFTVQRGRPGAGRASVAHLSGVKPPAEPDEAVASVAEFDPGEFTVADVQTYVDGHADELDAILAAERAGKDRTTLIDWLESHAERNTETP
jgi:hypothetical protein